MHFSDVFKALCKQKHIPQKQALADMGIAESTTQRWKTGDPSLKTLNTIRGYFGITSDSVLDTLFEDGGNRIEGKIIGSAVVQGNSGSTIRFNSTARVNNENRGADPLNEQETELLRVFRNLNMRGKTAVLSSAYTEEERQEK